MMRGADLAAEMRQCLQALQRQQADFLISRGVDPFLIAIYQMVGVGRVGAGEGGLFNFANDGRTHFITPVRTVDASTPFAADPWAAVRFGEIIDLVAWCPSQTPLARLGNALSIGAVPTPSLEPFPVQMRSTVFHWLRSGCTGLVLLTRDPKQQAGILSMFDHGISAASKKQAEQFKAALRVMRRAMEPDVTTSVH
jgi:hypothetical protein